MRNLDTIFHSGYTNFYCYQQFPQVPFCLYPCQHLLFLIFFFILAILRVVRWYLIVCLIHISPLIINIEHLFTCLLAICTSSLEKNVYLCFSWSLSTWREISNAQHLWTILFINFVVTKRYRCGKSLLSYGDLFYIMYLNVIIILKLLLCERHS